MSVQSNHEISVVFLGTPHFASESLKTLIEQKFDVRAVITQPDRPAGRGATLTAPPVKVTALEHNIPVVQPTSLKDFTLSVEESGDKVLSSMKEAEAAQFLNKLGEIDFFVCVAYGQIIPQALLDFPNNPVLNIHPSLLPRWRGAAPIQRAIAAGDEKTGVCIMELVQKLDAGPVYAVEEVPIKLDDTSDSLHRELARKGAQLLCRSIPCIVADTLRSSPQDESLVTYASKWEKVDSCIDWSQQAEVIDRSIRASYAIPGARTTFDGNLLKVFRAEVVSDSSKIDDEPGTVVKVNREQLYIATGSGQSLSILELQFPGKKRLPIAEVLKSRAFTIGDRLG